ncbi:MAG: hypothetical protein H0V44_18370 [Planctomycetes bacterium]|nr:hypothetical protein [Planctomycetota bacterium]
MAHAWSTRWRTRCVGVTVVLSWSASAGAVEESPAVAAARAAIAAGQAVEAERLVADSPGIASKGPELLILARARLALGRPEECLRSLGIADAATALAAIARWKAPLSGEAAQLGSEALLATPPVDHAVVSSLLQTAIDHPGVGVEADRCLALFCQSCLLAGRNETGMQAAAKLWQDWPRSRYRVRGGLVVARAVAQEDPDRARLILTTIRVDSAISAQDRLDAAEQLCHVLLGMRAGECLVVAEQEIARLAQDPVGQLPLYRALALARLQPSEGLAAMRALPAPLAADPAVQAAIFRAEASVADGGARGPAIVIERARADVELGRVAEARALLEPLAATEPEALALLASLPGIDARKLAQLPTAASEHAVLAVVRALHDLRDPLATAQARALLSPFMAAARARARSPLPASDVLFWAARCAGEPTDRRALRAELFALERSDLATALGWCDAGQDLELAGQDAVAAWSRAAALLPAAHPWAAEAAWRAARSLVAAGDLRGGRTLLDGPASWLGDDEARLRCRFLLCQIQEREGDPVSAVRTAESLAAALPPGSDPQRRSRVEGVIKRLREARRGD